MGSFRQHLYISASAALVFLLVSGVSSDASIDATAKSTPQLRTTGSWSPPAIVPGIVALDHFRFNSAVITVVSCPTRNWCGAAGTYGDARGHTQAFVVVGGAGASGLAREVPGLAMLNHGDATLTSLSCSAPGNCSAGGSYEGATHSTIAYLVDEVHGSWKPAHTVVESPSGTASTISSISCTGVGDCSAVGSSSTSLPFVVSEVQGAWGSATSVPGISLLGTIASLSSISCAAPGDCSAGGYVGNSTIPQNPQPLLVDQASGSWGNALEIPGAAALNVDNIASATSVSCGAPGNCSAGGYYTDGAGAQQLFIAIESSGTWHNAQQLPGTAALNGGGFATLTSLSCPRSGSCAAVGSSSVHVGSGSLFVSEPFVAQESADVWKPARIAPGATKFQGSNLTSISCSAPTACTAVGSYTTSHGKGEPLATDEVNGSWQAAYPIPGMYPLEKPSGAAVLTVVSCAASRTCVAGGWVQTMPSTRWEAMLISESPPQPPPTISRLAPSSGSARGGTTVVIYGTHLESTALVRFNGRAATDVDVVNPDALRVISPAGAGTVNVRVTTDSGTSVPSRRTRFTYR